MPLLSGCAQRTTDNTSRTITVSIEPQRYLLEQIAGDRWSVSTLLDRGSDPENFDPPMSALQRLHDSGIYFTTGHIPFEDIVLQRIATDSMTVIDTSDGIEPIRGTHSGSDSDPHVWSSVKNARIISRNMLQALVKLDPAGKEYYTANFNRLATTLDSLDTVITQRLEKHSGTAFLVWHPSLSYFARDYHLMQIALGMEHKEISAESLKLKIDTAQAHRASIFFVQPDMDNSRAESISHQAGSKTVTINPLSYDWPGEMMKIAEALVPNSLQTDIATAP